MGISREVQADRLAEDWRNRAPPLGWSTNPAIAAYRPPSAAQQSLAEAVRVCVLVAEILCVVAGSNHGEFADELPRGVPTSETRIVYGRLNADFKPANKLFGTPAHFLRKNGFGRRAQRRRAFAWQPAPPIFSLHLHSFPAIT
jgi:hypothetical protein